MLFTRVAFQDLKIIPTGWHSMISKMYHHEIFMDLQLMKSTKRGKASRRKMTVVPSQGETESAAAYL